MSKTEIDNKVQNEIISKFDEKYQIEQTQNNNSPIPPTPYKIHYNEKTVSIKVQSDSVYLLFSMGDESNTKEGKVDISDKSDTKNIVNYIKNWFRGQFENPQPTEINRL